jgi:hypothetical protein
VPYLVSDVIDSIPAPEENFETLPATAAPEAPAALAPTLLYSQPKFLKGMKVNLRSDTFSSDSV